MPDPATVEQSARVAFDLSTLLQFATIGLSAGGLGTILGRRTAAEKLEQDGELAHRREQRERIDSLEGQIKTLQDQVNELTLKLGGADGDLRARDGRIEVLERDLAARTEERDEAREQLAQEILDHADTRAERDRLRMERGRAVEGLVTAAHVAPGARAIAESIIPSADEAHSLAGRLEDGPSGEGLHSLSDPSDGDEGT